MKPKSSSVFISYSRDPDHKADILAFSHRLIKEGIDCDIDRYIEGATPEMGWIIWMENKIRTSDYVLVACSEKYLKKLEGVELQEQSLGVPFEYNLLIIRLYENRFAHNKIIPIVFNEHDRNFVPMVLRPFTIYNVTNEQDYELLYRRLTNQIEIVKPPRGELIILPTATNLENNQPQKRFINQFIIIEDETEAAQTFVRHLDIDDIIPQVIYIKDIEALTNFISDYNPKRIFWVDINLGIGREDEGLAIIKTIRKYCPPALIIVYSGYEDRMQKSLELGADKFFLKGFEYQRNIAEIRDTLVAFLTEAEK